MNKITPTTSLDVANYILYLSHQKNFEIGTLKLQKIIWYSQIYYFSLKGELLFNETFHAWKYGPVVRSVWDQYNGEINWRYFYSAKEKTKFMDKETKDIIEKVFNFKYNVNPFSLANETHGQEPWFLGREDEDMLISNTLLKKNAKKIVEEFLNYESGEMK